MEPQGHRQVAAQLKQGRGPGGKVHGRGGDARAEVVARHATRVEDIAPATERAVPGGVLCAAQDSVRCIHGDVGTVDRSLEEGPLERRPRRDVAGLWIIGPVQGPVGLCDVAPSAVARERRDGGICVPDKPTGPGIGRGKASNAHQPSNIAERGAFAPVYDSTHSGGGRIANL